MHLCPHLEKGSSTTTY